MQRAYYEGIRLPSALRQRWNAVLSTEVVRKRATLV